MTTTPTLSPSVESKWPPGDNSCTVERWQEPTHLASAAPDNEQPHAAKRANVRTSGKERILEKQSGINETEEADYSGSKNQRGSSGADCWHLPCRKTPLINRVWWQHVPLETTRMCFSFAEVTAKRAKYWEGEGWIHTRMLLHAFRVAQKCFMWVF